MLGGLEMVVELRTMHDLFWLENLKCCGCGSCDQGCGCDVKMIKREVIKWVNSYRSWDKEINGNLGEDIALQFMLFFNITEEDLL